MATQNPNRLRTNCPGGSLTLGGDTTVNRLGFGAMRLCGPGVWGEPLDRPGAKRVLMRAIELGITLVDTADAYGTVEAGAYRYLSAACARSAGAA